jgi:hypothetical protein
LFFFVSRDSLCSKAEINPAFFALRFFRSAVALSLALAGFFLSAGFFALAGYHAAFSRQRVSGLLRENAARG